MKPTRLFVLAVSTMVLMLSTACGNTIIQDTIKNEKLDDDVVPVTKDVGIDGLITEETGSTYDYIGWWQLTDNRGDAPFAYIEIPEDDASVVNCYDRNGGLIDTGYFDYSEQRALNGNALIVFVFESIGPYAWGTYSNDDLFAWNQDKLDGTLKRVAPDVIPKVNET